MDAQPQRDFTFGRPGKWCHGPCGCKWPLEFFRKNPDGRPGKNSCPEDDRRARCKGCEGRSRHAVDPMRRWLEGTLARHAGYADRHDMGRITGMTVDYLLPIAEREIESGCCPHCGVSWQDLLTRHHEKMELDRIDRNRPLTRSNFQFMCKTGNRQKGKDDPTDFDISQHCWAIYVDLDSGFFIQMRLFDEL